MSRLAIIDLETTGLDPSKHEIIEIGMVIVDSDTFTILDEFNVKVVPERPEDGDPAAFKVNGYDPDDWADALTLHQAILQLSEHAQNTIFMAFNVTFDWSFMQAALTKTGHANPFHYHRLDLLSMAWMKIPHSKMNSWALKAVCAYLRVPREPAIHRAINGALAAYNVYRELFDPRPITAPAPKIPA